MKLKNLLMLLATLALLVGATGCIFSPEDPPDEEIVDTGRPDNTTKTIMMDNFKDIYEEMDSGDFEDLLHPSYRTVLLQDTFDSWEGSDTPLTELYFDRVSEIQIHRNMFEGLGGVNEAGIAQPPIDAISVDLMEKTGDWESVEASEEYFGGFDGAVKAQYELLIYFENPGNHRFEVDQSVYFYLIQGSDGMWKMLGQKNAA